MPNILEIIKEKEDLEAQVLILKDTHSKLGPILFKETLNKEIEALEDYIKERETLIHNLKFNTIHLLNEKLVTIKDRIKMKEVEISGKTQELEELINSKNTLTSEESNIILEINKIKNPNNSTEFESRSKVYIARYLSRILPSFGFSIVHVSQSYLDIEFNNISWRIATCRPYNGIVKISIPEKTSFIAINFNPDHPDNIDFYCGIPIHRIQHLVKDNTITIQLDEVNKYEPYTGYGFTQALLRKSA